MADIYFYVEGYYQKKGGKPSSWRRVRKNEVNDKIRNPASNYNCFATVQQFKNAVAEQSEPQICDLFFDLDGTIEQALTDAKKLSDYFGQMGIGKEAIRVWFSGKKGFHILINHRVIGAVPHPELTRIYKKAAYYVAGVLELKTFDHLVYSIKRMLRLPQSIHRDTGKFKIELSREDLEKTPKEIKALASQPGQPLWGDTDTEDLAENDTAVAWYRGFVESYENEQSVERLRPRAPIKQRDDDPVCVSQIINRDVIAVSGGGNKTALALATYYKDKGRSAKETLAILEPWVLGLRNTSTANNRGAALASIRSVVHSVFEFPDRYRFACAFIRATGNAENPIACLGDRCVHVDSESQQPDDPIELHLSQASRAEFVGKKLCIQTTIAGKDSAPYIVPRKYEIECIPKDGKFCPGCPSVTYGGKFELEFKPYDENLIAMCKTSSQQTLGILKRRAKIPQTCKQHRMRILDRVNIEEVRLIPQLDFSEQQSQEFAQRLGFYIGHGIRSNERYKITGYTIPDPTTQAAVQTFEQAEPSENNIQAFEADKKLLDRLKIFRPLKKQTVEDKIKEIHADLEANVTKVYRRNLMATSLDLIYHTILSFNFNNNYVHKGWGELLILGDSGQAKTTLVQRIRSHYQAGEVLNGESATRTGLLYTLTEATKRWMLVWGRIPLNDQALLVIDEASGLSHSDIAQLSGARASGIAEVNRVGISAQTPCRTRLVFSSNPRTGRPLRLYQWPVLAICGFKELIEKSEDVRRFDFAIAVKSGDVDPDIMNQTDHPEVEHVYTSYLCNLLIRWAWSRRADHVEFTKEATKDILSCASTFARTYHSSIPLVEPADQRLKIARISAAVAARVFSTDESMEKVIVTADHVEYAIGVMMSCFETLGYDRFSKQTFGDSMLTDTRKEEVLNGYRKLIRHKELAQTLLRYKQRPFTKKVLQEQMNYDGDCIRDTMHFMSKHGLIEHTGHGYIKKEYFIEFLNEILGGATDVPETVEAPVTGRRRYDYDE